MEPDVQRNVDIVWMENIVSMSTGLVTVGVRLGIMVLDAKEVKKNNYNVYYM